MHAANQEAHIWAQTAVVTGRAVLVCVRCFPARYGRFKIIVVDVMQKRLDKALELERGLW